MPPNDSPQSGIATGIRAVFLAGFLSGTTAGLVYLIFTGHLLESARLNPIALLGAFLGVGLLGTMTGALVGFALRMILKRFGNDGWLAPVVAAAMASLAVGLYIAVFVVALLFD